MNNKGFNIYASRYTKESWIKTYGENTLNEWEKLNCPNHMNEFIIKTKDRITRNNNIDKITPLLKIVPIDEEYFNWINKNALKNTTYNRKKYISQIVNEENAYRLIEKNNWNVDYIICGIPIIIETKKENTVYSLNKETKKELTFYLEKIFGNENVLVFNKILKCSDFFEEENLFLKIGQNFFEKNIYKENKKTYKQQKDINEMVIPIIIKKSFITGTFNLNQYIKENSFFNKEYILDNNFLELEKMIKQCIIDKCFIKNSLIKTNFLIECIDTFYDDLLDKRILKIIEKFSSSKAAKIKIEKLF